MRRQLETIANQYSGKVSEDKHIENIRRLSDELRKNFSDCLVNGRFRIGSAQKALNLHLKYLWRLGRISTPPHCPFDFFVINKLSLDSPISWTKLDDIEGYKELVEDAKRKANGVSLAEWEYEEYEKEREKARERARSQNSTS